MLKDFYLAFSPSCFSLLGLWFVVITINARGWLLVRQHRLWAYTVVLYFAAPGAMSLLALTDTQSPAVWRVSFAAVSLIGLVGVASFGRVQHSRQAAPEGDGDAGKRPHDWPERFDHLTQWLTIALYAAILVLAYPTLRTLRIEGVLLTALLLLGIYVAFRLMILVGPPDQPAQAPQSAGPGPARG